jgi:Uma2 family endonuclease
MGAINESTPDGVIYPSGDGKPMAETGIHVLVMLSLIGTLRLWFRSRRDVYVIGNIFLYYREGHPEARRSPDVMVIKGVDASWERRSFKTWEEKAAPSVIFEITSDETANEDQQAKRQLYQKLGVREYILFDPLHDYLPRQLMCYRLVDGRYQAVALSPDGSLDSTELGLRLVPEGMQLGLFDLATGERLLEPVEMQDHLQEAERVIEQSTERARKAERRAARQDKRVAKLEAELERLRTQLPSGSKGKRKRGRKVP